MTEPTFYLEDLSPNELSLLAQLLSIHPHSPISSSWLNDQSQLLSTFPSTLLNPRSLLLRLVHNLPFAPGKANLCSNHKPLNAILIRRIFLEASLECTARLDRLAKNEHLPRAVGECVKRLQAVNSLWMSPELYRAMFLPQPEDERYEMLESACEACILASMGGNHSILSDMRASILGRRKKGRPNTALLEMVGAWLDWTGRGEEICAESDVLAKQMRLCRRLTQKARRRRRACGRDGMMHHEQDHMPEHEYEHEYGQERGTGTETEALPDDAGWEKEKELDDEQRAERENELIDYYAKRICTMRPMSSMTTVEGLHEAFRGSIVFDAENRTFCRIVPESNTRKAYTQSMYSSIDRRSSSEQYAQSYQTLLGMSDNDEEPRERTTRQESRPEIRMTRWSGFK